MPQGVIIVSYIAATILFILALRGLSHPETARRGNLYGIIGMTLAILATVISDRVSSYVPVVLAMAAGGSVGIYVARKVQMTEMPELVAILHSLVGMAAVLIGFANYIDPNAAFEGAGKTVHELEIYLGILIGAVTFTGSVVAYGKLCGKISGKPVLLPARHWLNLGLLVLAILLGKWFLNVESLGIGLIPLILMTLIAFAFGVHMVMAIGGADMPVVVSMLNSYSGWAASATGFMLSNDLLIVTGALVGSSGAILSYIMCRAMNRNFISVIAGGFGTEGGAPAAAGEQGEVHPIDPDETAELLEKRQERHHRARLRYGGGPGPARRCRDRQDPAGQGRQCPFRDSSGGRTDAGAHECSSGRGQDPL
jgi:NAD/NADP transhydrogenase beta subunit